MKMKKSKTFLMLLAISFCTGMNSVQAQDIPIPEAPQTAAVTKAAESQFMVVGLTTFGFVNQTTTNTLGGLKSTDKYNSLGDADRFEFSPMFLWRHGDNLLLEFEPAFDGTNIGVNWADISYYAAPNLIIRGGYFVLPFGIYNKRLAAGWINKLTSDPIGMDVAGTDFGVEIEGGLPLGSMKLSYDISLTNGQQLNNDGTINGVGITAIGNGKTVCGRIGFLPMSNSSLEIGVSGLMGSLANPNNMNYNNPMSTMYAVDLNYVKNIKAIQLNIKGQYNISTVNAQSYISPIDSTKTYSFTNTTTSAFGQISLRPAQSKNKVLKNLELAFRYVDYVTPQNSTWGQNYSEEDIALDYWLSWRTVLKAGYEIIKSDGTSSVALSGTQGSTSINRLIIQFSTEF